VESAAVEAGAVEERSVEERSVEERSVEERSVEERSQEYARRARRTGRDRRAPPCGGAAAVMARRQAGSWPPDSNS
jgi:hypothetical protein